MQPTYLKLMLVLLLIIGAVVVAGELPQGAVQVTPATIQWNDAPAPFPKGSKMALLYGDPKKSAPFAMRFRLPANLTLPVHFHSGDECVTVIQGSMNVGFGDTLDTSKATNFPAGSFYVNPANAHHFVFTGPGGADIQINSVGPWTIEYVR